ncbi:MAG: TlpA family protein disulfide reductase [Phycisphaerales bacterium]|nr:TlpA family protein disulfide reductase [Phycisphaerales bacterium]
MNRSPLSFVHAAGLLVGLATIAPAVLAQESNTPAPTPPPAPAQASTDPVQAMIDAFKAKREELSKDGAQPSRAAVSKAADEVFQAAALDTKALTAAQIKLVNEAGIINALSAKNRPGFVLRLHELGKATDAAGAQAAMMALGLAGAVPPPKQGEILATALGHPSLKNVIGEPESIRALASVARLDDEAVKGSREKLLGIGSILPESIGGQEAAMLGSLVVGLANDTTPAEREPLRAKVLALVTKARDAASETDRARPRLVDMAKTLDGAFVRTGLVGETAPELDLVWASGKFGSLGSTAPKKLSDLKGNVVVLDFWATWCGPCIASFPRIRDLQKHYEGYPVVILGVTSVQGFHIDTKASDPKARRIDTKGDATREMELMKSFIDAENMTWSVVFSSQPVFNPEYGVQGIPHVAILDAKGVVRKRGLHPMSGTLADKIAEIDGLLKEAGLPTPPAAKP